MYRKNGGGRVKVSRGNRSLWLSVGTKAACIHAVDTGSSHSPGDLADQLHLGGHSLLPLPGGGKEGGDGQPVTLTEGIPPGLYAL